jgi:hypothetical protein
MSKPKFYQSELKEIKGNVLDHVYPQHKGENQMTVKERMGSEEGNCPDCPDNRWIIFAEEHAFVQEGGKPYISCMGCGYVTHL